MRYSQFYSPVTRLSTPIFEKCPSKKFFDQLLIFVIMYQHAKNQCNPSVHSSDRVNFRVWSPDWPHPFLTMLTQKIFNQFLICVKLYQHAKNQFTLSLHSWNKISFRVQRPDWSHPFLTMHNQTFFDQLSIYKNLFQHAKNEDFIDLFWRNGWFKNPAIWIIESILAYISGKKSFPNRGFVQEHRK